MAHMPVKVVTAKVGGRTIGIDIMAVRKIMPYTRPTPLPHQAEHVLGVINLRGTILPVFDLASRLGWDKSVDESRSVIMVAEAQGREQAMVVDAEGDILAVDPQRVQPAPTIDGVASNYVRGLLEVGDRRGRQAASERSMIVLLDPDALALSDA